MCVLVHVWAGVRLVLRGAGLGPPVGYLYWPFWGGTSFVDHLPAVNRLLAVPGRYFFCGSFASNEQITGRSGAVLFFGDHLHYSCLVLFTTICCTK